MTSVQASSNPCRILLGITAGIAAYKTPELVRQLQKAGFELRVVMSKQAKRLVSRAALQAVSGSFVHSQLFDATSPDGMRHIELARWAEKMLIAPATADAIARISHGRADDLLTSVILASESPLYLVPAMNLQMWEHPATQHNIQVLQQRGVTILGPDTGDLACGENGLGRMLELGDIVNFLQNEQKSFKRLAGKQIVVTAGATREAIDPVRFISNRSSGKMGHAMAEAASKAGAQVHLITASTLPPPPGLSSSQLVTTSSEMFAAVQENLGNCDIFIATAAVSDYQLEKIASQKVKKNSSALTLTLVPTTDILLEVASSKHPPYCVGFAAETENLRSNAISKKRNKALPMLVANPIADGVGFDSNENEALVLLGDRELVFPRMSKRALADQLITLIANETTA